MNLVRKTIEGAAIGVAVADTPASLKAFLQPGCAAAVWRRQTPPAVQAWLDALGPEVLPRGRVVLPAHKIGQTVEHLFDIAGLPKDDSRDWLHADIVSLADMFADLLGVTYLRLRLEPVTTNACRKFHIDAITARLVCTYRGPGT
ncbi:MAG: DUF1826 domain-containing protein, partial [Pseudomonadota bacterium]